MAAFIILLLSFLYGCKSADEESAPTSTPSNENLPPIKPTASPTLTEPGSNPYEFPASIDPEKRYLFYLHGKIIEDQGIPAVSPQFGEYEYLAILEKLSSYGFVVISEQRPQNTDGLAYAQTIKEQVTNLLDAGVPAANITVVGASKGAGITVEVSNLLENEEINYVILAICHPDNVAYFISNDIFLTGNVLSIYDSEDVLAGTCENLFLYSADKGLSRYAEIVLYIGTGHGILFQPLDEWILPTVAWANGESP